MMGVGVFDQEARASAPTSAAPLALVDAPEPIAAALARLPRIQWRFAAPQSASAGDAEDGLRATRVDSLVYVPRAAREPDLDPDVLRAEMMCRRARHAGIPHLVLVSSTAAYGATPHHPGLVAEQRAVAPAGQVSARVWHNLESRALDTLGRDRVTILRAAPVPLAGGRDFFSRLLSSPLAFPLTGHDPTLQFLSLADLSRAIACAVQSRTAGVFNIVPSAPVPLRAALRAAGCRAVAVPWSVQWPCRAALRTRALIASPRQIQFVRYHLTASGDAAAAALGFVPRDTSLDAIHAMNTRVTAAQPGIARSKPAVFDPFGLDREYIDACWRGVIGALHRRYWRVETRGLDRIPRSGGAVLVGMHRGFMPFDGVMTLLSVVNGTGRVPRFLIHPGVGLRFPFLFDLMSKLGGVIACQENAARVLAAGELLGVYPEGIRGAFTMYKRAHRIGPSWRNDCIAFALKHQVPIVPFVTVGSAEIFPILGRIRWAWWKKYSEWPFIPITPTFPLLPVPLPSKWHTLFLEPVHVARDHRPADADDPVVVRALGAEIKHRMETATAELLARRRSIFYGSAFEDGQRER